MVRGEDWGGAVFVDPPSGTQMPTSVQKTTMAAFSCKKKVGSAEVNTLNRKKKNKYCRI